MFPITGLRCKELKHVELTEQGEHYARIDWGADYEGGTDYQVQLVDTSRQGTGVILQDEVQDSTYMFTDLYAGHAYTAMVRKRCHYQTAHYDTLLWGAWQQVNFEMEPDPVDTTATDTTIVDTTIVDTTGIRLTAVGDADFSLRPNPAVAAAVVTLQYAVAEVAELQLVDLHGRTVQHHVLPAGTKQLTLDLAQLPAGAYLVKLVTPRGLSARRLVVRK